MLADADCGNIVVAAQAGTRWGYALLPLVLLLIPLLYMMQELAVRLGVFSGRGFAESISCFFGRKWGWLMTGAVILAGFGTLITEFAGIAGIGELYGLPRLAILPPAALAVCLVVTTGSYRRTERVALVIGLLELAFFFTAWVAHPQLTHIARDIAAVPFGDRRFLLMAAAIIGAVFNPWMVFYQQSAIADRSLPREDYQAERWDTAIGAILTQFLMAAVLVTVAAAGRNTPATDLTGIGDVGISLRSLFGETAGQAVFSLGVLGAAMVAAIVSSLTMTWALGEVSGHRHELESHPMPSGWLLGLQGGCIAAAAAVVWAAQDLIWLNIETQVLNAFLLPLVAVFLVVLSLRVLPPAHRPHGWGLGLTVGGMSAASLIGIAGGLAGFLG